MSLGPPGGNGSTMRMGLLGYAFSDAMAGHSVHVNTTLHTTITGRFILVELLGAEQRE